MTKGSETGMPPQICSALWTWVISQDTWKELTLIYRTWKLGVLLNEIVFY